MRLIASSLVATIALGTALAGAATGNAATPSDEALIANATSAAPEAVARNATVMAMDEKGAMRVLRKGSGNFTCMPDNPMSPGNDPMCVDANGMAWAEAWMTHKTPPAGKVGFGYMLMGGSDASNSDPFASEPAPGHKWVETGPHVMVLNAGDMVAGYPSQKDNPDTSLPYVMWPGTPYEHLMIPVR